MPILSWAVWFAIPEQPLQTLIFRDLGHGYVTMSPDGRYACVDSNDGQGPKALLRLSDGKEVIPREMISYEPRYLEGDRVVFRETDQDHIVRILDLTTGLLLAEYKDVWLTKWSKQGAVIMYAAEPDIDQGALFLVTSDTAASSRVINLTDADAPISFDASGTHMVSLMRDDPATFAVWDARDGRLIRRYRSAAGKFGSIEISHDGRKVVGSVEEEDSQGKRVESTFLWDISDGANSEPQYLGRALNVHQDVFDPHDRYFAANRFSQVAELWDITAKPPTHTKVVGVVYFDPTGRRYLVGSGGGFRAPADWSLHDAKSHRRIHHFGFSHYHVPSSISPNGRWMAFESKHSGDLLDYWWNRIFNSPLRPYCGLDVFDLEADRIIKRIWDGPEAACITSAGRLWTADSGPLNELDENSPVVTTFHEWSVLPVRPPWWLYLLTAAGLFVILADLRRTWKRRAQPAAT